MMREGLKALIAQQEGLTVVGEADNGKSTVAMARNLGVHVVVMDVAMPDLNGIEATRKIIASGRGIKVVALSGHADRQFVAEMLKAGASAYVLKQRAYEDLVRAIREVMSGRTYLSPEVTRGVVDLYLHGAVTPGEKPAFATLTSREREVLQCLAEGKSAKVMAADMGVSEKTIATHRRNIMEKLNLHSVAELTKYAIREGVTSVDV